MLSREHKTQEAHVCDPHVVPVTYRALHLKQTRQLAVGCSLDEAEIFQDRLRVLITHFPSVAMMIRAGI